MLNKLMQKSFLQTRHPELVSGSILPLYPSASVARWMLKQVQHDGLIAGSVL
jgi:hypothetical protein